MTLEQRQEIINRIVYRLTDKEVRGVTVEKNGITRAFKKSYTSEKDGNGKADKKITSLEYIGLSNISKNVMGDDGTVKSEFNKNGEIDKDKVSEVTNRAMAVTYAYALELELEAVYEELNKRDTKITELEKRISALEKKIK